MLLIREEIAVCFRDHTSGPKVKAKCKAFECCKVFSLNIEIRINKYCVLKVSLCF
jgi:hypothetical protein